MILAEPPRSQADLKFQLAGFPIRITPFFWIMAGVVVHRGVSGNPRALLVGIAAVFLSILIHELGHAFAFRRFGMDARVVLYHFGGLAIPSSQFSGYGSTPYLSGPRQITIAAAGPLAQLLGALVVIGIVLVSGHWANTAAWISWIGFELPARWLDIQLQLLPSTLDNFVHFFLVASVYWALLNLLPIYPLDGGQIARELFLMGNRSEALKRSLIVSFATAAAVAGYGLFRGGTFMVILFGMLAFSNYQMLQAIAGNHGDYGQKWS